ncbi:MAG TPA: hypothetical protein VMW08_00305 [Acidimicrobiales bacterium]|nr:hypothetical protein [Acidimicrobiales bacterium]
MMNHTNPEPPRWRPRLGGLPWAGEVSDDQLGEWGWPVLRTEKMMGTTITVREGMHRHLAVHEAWGAHLLNVGGTNSAWLDWREQNPQGPRGSFDHEVHAWLTRQRQPAAA